MIELGYGIASEEHRPNDLVRYAARAEEAGFSFASISDHFHPWVDAQGESPFAWTVIGGIAHATSRLKLGTGVTCPTVRYHPAIVAQAAATAASMMEGRFFLGVGSGEALNEHIVGQHWPSAAVRQEMLEEAIDIIRLLWEGGMQDYYGAHFTLENARLYTLPEQAPELILAAGGKKSAELAARLGDGMMSTAPGEELVQAYEGAGGSGPKYGQMAVCWAPTEAEGRRTAYEVWPTAGLKGWGLQSELPLPSHFEEAVATVREEDVAESVVCGPDPERYIKQFKVFEKAGFTHLAIHHIGQDQEGFFRFFERELATVMTPLRAAAPV
jgi:G6PDH family F420-dependent oxidoreductase